MSAESATVDANKPATAALDIDKIIEKLDKLVNNNCNIRNILSKETKLMHNRLNSLIEILDKIIDQNDTESSKDVVCQKLV